MFKYIARVAAIIFYLLGLAGSVYIVRIIYGAYKQSGMEKKWVQIPSPAEPLTTLIAGDTGEIFAEGENGGLYQFSVYPGLTWKKIDGTENALTDIKCSPITEDTYKSEPMSGTVKLQVSVDCGFAEQTLYINVSLLENGETWYSEKAINAYATIGLLLLLPIGVIIDLVLYVTSLFFLALDIIITLRRKAKQAGSM